MSEGHDKGCRCNLKPIEPCEKCGSTDWEQTWYDTGERPRIGWQVLQSMSADKWICGECGVDAPGDAGIGADPKDKAEAKIKLERLSKDDTDY